MRGHRDDPDLQGKASPLSFGMVRSAVLGPADHAPHLTEGDICSVGTDWLAPLLLFQGQLLRCAGSCRQASRQIAAARTV